MSDDLIERGIERDRIQRHLDVDGSGELRTHAAHALASGAFALMALAFKHNHAAAACSCEVIGNAGAHDAAADDDYIRCLHTRDMIIGKEKRHSRKTVPCHLETN